MMMLMVATIILAEIQYEGTETLTAKGDFHFAQDVPFVPTS